MRRGRAPLLVAVGLVVAALVFGVVVTAGGGGRGGDPLDTAGAADAIDAIVGAGRPSAGGRVESCPAGDLAGLLAELDATDLDQAELLAYAFEDVGDGVGVAACELVFDDGDGSEEIAVVMSAQADAAVELFRDDVGVGVAPLDDARGGQVLGGCADTEDGPQCEVAWWDDEVMVAISGEGSPFADLDAERVAHALVTSLPELVDRLAG